jgi:hypothetical protein
MFTDPENKDEIYSSIQQITNASEIYSLVKNVFPDWIIDECKDYEPYYESFRINWHKLTNRFLQEPKKILIVEQIVFEDPDNQYTILRMFCELLTRTGFCVRRKEELKKCKDCGMARLIDTETCTSS